MTAGASAGSSVSGMPDISGAWYTPQYPNGIRGVWDKYSSQISNSTLVSFVTSFKNVEISGPCCTYQIDTGMFGVMDFTIPENVIAALKAIVLSYTIFVGLRLVFGG